MALLRNLILAAVVAGTATPLAAQAATPAKPAKAVAAPVPAATPALDPDAAAALDRMGAYLRTLKNFDIHVESSSDTILQHTAVTLLDSYLNTRTVPISQSEFQCVGAACLVKALQDVCQLDCIKVAMSCVLTAWYTKDVCSAEDVIATVQHIDSTLPPHREGAPVHSIITRLLRSMRKAASGSRTFCLTHYLGELALQSEAMLMFTPEDIACACFAVACNCLGWNETIFMSVIAEVRIIPFL